MHAVHSQLSITICSILNRKVLNSSAMKWLSGIYFRVYATLVQEDIPPGYRTHVLVMRVTGAWPTANDPHWYQWLTIALFLFAGIISPISMSVNIFYATSVQEFIQLSFASVSAWSAIIKMFLIYWRRDSIRAFFRIHKCMLNSAGRQADADDRVARTNSRVHTILTAIYVLWICLAIIQSIFARVEDKIFMSTLNWPSAFAQRRPVYWFVLMFQAYTAVNIGLWAGIGDSLPIALINTVRGHLAQLKRRLRNWGTENGTAADERDTQFHADLIDCCKYYDECLK